MIASHAAKRSALALLLAAGVLAGHAHAAPPVDTRFTYQGRLSEDGVLASGTYDLLFSVYPSAVSGAPLAIFAADDVTVANGLFQTEVNFPQSVYTGAKLFMQVEVRPGASVGAYSILGARQELLAVPFATKTLIPDSLQNAYDAGRTISASSGPLAINSLLTFGAAPGNADAIHITTGQLRVGSLFTTQRGQIFLNNATTSTNFTMYAGTVFGVTTGDALAGFSSVGAGSASFLTANELFYLGPTNSSSSGGMLHLGGASTSPSTIKLDGRGGSPTATLTGAAASIVLDPDNSIADNKVQLPVSSVWSAEMGDEPGVASAGEGAGNVLLTGGIDQLLTRTITTPAAGYVLVIASCQAQISHTTGTISSADFGVSTLGSSFPVNQDVDLNLPSTAASGTYAFPVTVHGLFSVPGGPITMQFLARRNIGAAGSQQIFDTQLTCVYIPTSYGTVVPTLLGGPPDSKNFRRAPITGMEIADEQQQSIRDNMARVERENAEMRKRLEAIEAELRNQPRPSANVDAKPAISKAETQEGTR